MENKNNITFVIFTFNEENRIEYPIRNFINYGNVIIIDNFSSDNTQQIAEKLGAKVYKYKNPGYVETQKELDFVKSKIETDYMTWSFADHMWNKKLLEESIKITKKGIYDGIATIQKNYHYGIKNLNFKTFHWLGKKKSQHCIIFKKETLYCINTVHTALQDKCKNIYYMPTSEQFYLHHLSLYNVNKVELALNRYSNIESKVNFNEGKKVSFLKVFIKMILHFIKFYFYDGSWKNGKAGLIMVMQFMFFYFNLAAKQWELENNVTLESIENNYNKIRNKILQDINN